MDPKLSQLDPKLREAYQRVMDGQKTQAPAQNPAANPTPTQPSSVFENPQQTVQAPISLPQDQNISHSPVTTQMPGLQPTSPIEQPLVSSPNVPESTPQLQQPEPQPVQSPQAKMAPQPEPQAQQPSPVPPVAQNIGGSIAFNASGQTQTVVKKGGRSLSHVLLGLGALVFLVAYTFLWIFIFKIKLPFLPA